MTVVWDGIVREHALIKAETEARHALADVAKRYDWPRVEVLVAQSSDIL